MRAFWFLAAVAVLVGAGLGPWPLAPILMAAA